MSPLTERCPEKYRKKLIGGADIEDALKRLDKLTQEGARVEAAQNLNAMHIVEKRVMVANTAAIDSTMPGVYRVASVDGVKCMLSPNLISPKAAALYIFSVSSLSNLRRWLCPPDPSTNHNIACGFHHKKTATRFLEGSIFQEWKSVGSLLWVHGKRVSCPTSHPIPSDDILKCSWLRQEYPLVRGRLALSITSD